MQLERRSLLSCQASPPPHSLVAAAMAQSPPGAQTPMLSRTQAAHQPIGTRGRLMLGFLHRRLPASVRSLPLPFQPSPRAPVSCCGCGLHCTDGETKAQGHEEWGPTRSASCPHTGGLVLRAAGWARGQSRARHLPQASPTAPDPGSPFSSSSGHTHSLGTSKAGCSFLPMHPTPFPLF